MQYSYANGSFIERSVTPISLDDRCFKFGDGAFETMMVVNGKIFRFQQHLERLSASLKLLYIDYDIAQIPEICHQLIALNKLVNGYLRLTISRGKNELGYNASGATSSLYITANQADIWPDTMAELSLFVSSYRKISSSSYPTQAKSCNGAQSVLALIQAQRNQCDDALLLGDGEQICETISSNIFWIKDNVIFTPSLQSGVLPGIVREVIKQISGLQILENMFYIKDLVGAESVFITNIRRKISAVTKIKNNDGSVIANFSVTKNLIQLYDRLYRLIVEERQ